MTHSPRLAAMATNRPLGEDLAKGPAHLHRLAWTRRSRLSNGQATHPATETSFREQHA
jgi:hypothetical protein